MDSKPLIGAIKADGMMTGCMTWGKSPNFFASISSPQFPHV